MIPVIALEPFHTVEHICAASFFMKTHFYEAKNTFDVKS